MPQLVDQARSALLTRRRALLALDIDQSRLEESVLGDRGNDVADEASVVEAVTSLEGLRRVEGVELGAIDGALARIEQGIYGLCGACDQRIERRRLEAIPWTQVCRACAARAEPGSRHDA